MQAKHKIISCLVCINIGLLFLFFYFPLLSSGYIWDDIRIYKSILPTPDSLEIGYQPPFFQRSNFFRPLGYLVFISEIKLFGIDPRISHAVNILIHTMTMWMLFWIVITTSRQASAGKKIAIASAVTVIIGTLPTMAEPSSWISARFESVCAFFMASLVRTQISNIDINLKSGLFYVLMLAAISSKEMAITFIPSFVIFHALLNWNNIKKFGISSTFVNKDFLLPLLSIVAGIATYGVIRYALTDATLLTVNTPSSISPENHIRLIVDSLTNYISMLAWPWSTIKPFYFPDYTKPVNARELLILVAIPVVLSAMLYNSIKYKQGAWLVPILLTANILPATNIVPIFPELFSVSIRYLYIPILMCTVAFVIASDISVKQTNNKYMHAILAISFPAILAGNFIGTRNFIAQYETDEIFWEQVVSSVGVHHSVTAINAVNSKLEQFKYKEAELLINRHKHLLTKPDHNIPIWEASINYQLGKDLDKSLDGLERLIVRDSTTPEIKAWSYNMKALILAKQCANNQQILDAANNALAISENGMSQMIINAINRQGSSNSPSPDSGGKIKLHVFQQEALQKKINTFTEDLSRCSHAGT